MLSLLLTAYGAVLIAELVGDKTLYTLGTLATRFRLGPVLGGAALAFAIKMTAAVLLGQVLSRLPVGVVRGVSAATFFSMAIALWFKKPVPAPLPGDPPARWSSAAVTSFVVIFFPEWGDAGQLTAAMLVAQHHAPGVIWLGATLAMITKAAFAVTLGIGLRRFAPQRVVRPMTIAICVVMGCLAALGIEL